MRFLHITQDGKKYHAYLINKTTGVMDKVNLWNGETSVLEYDHEKAVKLAQEHKAILMEDFIS
jgi:type IV secretory pathway VirB9-like protein